MKIIILFATSTIIALFGVGCTTYVPEDENVNSWLDLCKTTKAEHYYEGSSAYVTYSPLQAKSINENIWLIEWYGFLIPMPVIKYSSVAIHNDEPNNKSIYMASDNEEFVLSLHYESYPEWSLVIPHSLRESVEAKEITLTHLIDYSYTITPNELSCMQGNISSDLMVFSGLGIKELKSHGKLLSAHIGVAGKPGWLTKSVQNDAIIWEAKMPGESNANEFISVVMKAKKNSKYSEIGGNINNAAINSIAIPKWVTEFNKIANNWDYQGLSKLAQNNHFRFIDFNSGPSAEEISERLEKIRSNKTNPADGKKRRR